MGECEQLLSLHYRRVTRVEYLRYPLVPFLYHVLCDLRSKFHMITCEKLEALTYKQQSVMNTVKCIRRYPVIGLSEVIMSTLQTLELSKQLSINCFDTSYRLSYTPALIGLSLGLFLFQMYLIIDIRNTKFSSTFKKMIFFDNFY